MGDSSSAHVRSLLFNFVFWEEIYLESTVIRSAGNKPLLALFINLMRVKVTKQQNVDNYFSVARQDIKFAVHAHPTLSEVLDELFKSAKVSHLKNLGNGFLLFLGTFARLDE